jgi:VIT1/CCC1 family predicted Fe2+/Mn2+ transporter
MRRKPIGDYIHSTFFGIEDSLISTTGVVAGVALSTQNHKVILATGLIVIIVEASSMAASELIAEEAEEDIDKDHKASPAISAMLMFISYFLTGIVPIIPLVVFKLPEGIYFSILLAMIGLIILGGVKGKVTKKSISKSIAGVLIVGSIATTIGVLAGILLKI